MKLFSLPVRALCHASVVSLVAVLGLSACQGRGQASSTAHKASTEVDSLDFAHEVQVEHAVGFDVVNHTKYKELILFTPGATDTLASYILYPRGEERPELGRTPSAYISVPCQRLACLTSTEVGALPILDLCDKLVACTNLDYISDSTIRQRIKAGQVEEIGRGMSRSIEHLIGVRPDVLLQDLYSATDKDQDLVASGINIVYYNNWKEQSLLGRAEWLKVIGLLFGRNKLADEAFAQMTRRYQEVKHLVASEGDTIEVLYGQDYKGLWYVPGEHSYVTQMLSDAGLVYDCIKGQVDSKPMSFEYIFGRHRHKKIWLTMPVGPICTLKQFLELNERYADLDATQIGRVWADNKRLNARGGNDLWESGLYHPDLILKDLVKISRPHLLPDYPTTYWQELER